MSRESSIERTKDGTSWDVIVLGGGASGLGVALDSALRGYRTLLVDALDFAKGTSSRSTKLIHGGVRYLASGQIGLVREALHERSLLLKNAPHLVRPQAFVIPGYRWLEATYYGVGLRLYDLLAGKSGLERSKIISKDETRRRLGGIKADGLQGGVVYHDARFDDARLAIAILRSFLDAGGTALNYAPATGFLKDRGRISGISLRDEESGEEWTVASKVVVSATGVFADEIRRLDDPSAKPIIRPSRGSHIVVGSDHLPGGSALMVPKTDDGRVLFAIPWQGRVLIGTTDVPVDDFPSEPGPTDAEIDYLLDHANRYLDRPISRADVLSTFAGLRPLVDATGLGPTKAISREHAALVSPSGLVTIVGGKWTTYRRMALDTLNKAVEVAGLPVRPCLTAEHRLHGAPTGSIDEEDPFSSYGSDATAIRALIGERPEWGDRLHPALPIVAVEVVWAARFEMARTVEDVLARRNRSLFLDAKASAEAAPKVAELLAIERKKGESWRRDQCEAFARLAAGYEVDRTR